MTTPLAPSMSLLTLAGLILTENDSIVLTKYRIQEASSFQDPRRRQSEDRESGARRR
jgi:hypothetical protein